MICCRTFDFFQHQKEEGFHGSLASMKQLSAWLLTQLSELEKSENINGEKLSNLWHILVQISLWGNKYEIFKA